MQEQLDNKKKNEEEIVNINLLNLYSSYWIPVKMEWSKELDQYSVYYLALIVRHYESLVKTKIIKEREPFNIKAKKIEEVLNIGETRRRSCERKLVDSNFIKISQKGNCRYFELTDKILGKLKSVNKDKWIPLFTDLTEKIGIHALFVLGIYISAREYWRKKEKRDNNQFSFYKKSKEIETELRIDKKSRRKSEKILKECKILDIKKSKAHHPRIIYVNDSVIKTMIEAIREQKRLAEKSKPKKQYTFDYIEEEGVGEIILPPSSTPSITQFQTPPVLTPPDLVPPSFAPSSIQLLPPLASNFCPPQILIWTPRSILLTKILSKIKSKIISKNKNGESEKEEKTEIKVTNQAESSDSEFSLLIAKEKNIKKRKAVSEEGIVDGLETNSDSFIDEDTDMKKSIDLDDLSNEDSKEEESEIANRERGKDKREPSPNPLPCSKKGKEELRVDSNIDVRVTKASDVNKPTLEEARGEALKKKSLRTHRKLEKDSSGASKGVSQEKAAGAHLQAEYERLCHLHDLEAFPKCPASIAMWKRFFKSNNNSIEECKKYLEFYCSNWTELTAEGGLFAWKGYQKLTPHIIVSSTNQMEVFGNNFEPMIRKVVSKKKMEEEKDKSVQERIKKLSEKDQHELWLYMTDHEITITEENIEEIFVNLNIKG